MKLSVKDGSFAYRKDAPVLEKLNFTVNSGDLMAILGPNGAGKTTLLRCLMGFLKWNGGGSYLGDTDIRDIPARKLWQRISYVPQARGAFGSLRAEDMILLGRTGRIGVFSTPSESDRKIVRKLAEELRIERLLDKKVNEISGGEAQMVFIARALAAEPDILILDEPESNLDFRNQLIVLDAMTRLAGKGIACIFNTHYPDHALTRANKSLILEKGGRALFGDTASIVTRENIRRAFGVESVIHEVETENSTYRGILPVRLADPAEDTEFAPDVPVIAVVSVILRNYESGAKVNAVLHDCGQFIIGRMGLPCPDEGLSVINITLDAPKGEVQSLVHRLSILPGVRVKAMIENKEEPYS